MAPSVRPDCSERNRRLHVQLLAPLSLRPGQPLGLPAAELPSVAFGIEWPFKAVCHVAAARIACRRHRLGSLQAALPGATNEKQFGIAICADGSERFGQTLDEGRI